MGYRENQKAMLDDFLNRVLKGEKKDFLTLTEKWNVVTSFLESEILDLVNLALQGRITPNQLFKLEAYRKFLIDSKYQVQMFSAYSETVISQGQVRNALLGLELGQKMLNGLGVTFTNLNVSATNVMIGMTSDGTPLKELLMKSYPETVQRLTNTLIEGTAMGKNPKVIARMMKEDMNGNLNRAFTIARTEELNAFRESNRQQLEASGFVDEWEWSAESDACDICAENDGKKFPITEQMDTHPNCRCGMLPVVLK